MAKSEKDRKEYPVFQKYFSKLQDPRRTSKGNILYPLEEILFLCISAVISGTESWTFIQEFGEQKIDWLRKFYPYKHGIPSHDVLGKLFSRICPETFNACFIDWVNSISTLSKGEIIAIDGKSIRGSGSKTTAKSAFHVVSAFACENGLCLGQKEVGDKSNEVTAIPLLLDLLSLKDCVITIDAMGCQKDIASAIIEQEADYILAVKGNQKELLDQTTKLFTLHSNEEGSYEHDLSHGRIEKRTCQVLDDLTFFDDADQWKGLQSIIKVSSERTIKSNGKTSSETRYYISSLPKNASKMNQAIRKHWNIENNLHWNLDVVFGEDSALKKKGFSALNFNIVLKTALTIINREKSTKKSKPTKRLKAALSDKYREKILFS